MRVRLSLSCASRIVTSSSSHNSSDSLLISAAASANSEPGLGFGVVWSLTLSRFRASDQSRLYWGRLGLMSRTAWGNSPAGKNRQSRLGSSQGFLVIALREPNARGTAIWRKKIPQIEEILAEAAEAKSVESAGRFIGRLPAAQWLGHS